MNKTKIRLTLLCIALLALFITSNTALASEAKGVLTNGEVVVIVSPTASPSAGTYTSVQSVSLSATGSSSIHYTTDGSDPTCTSGQTSQPIGITSTKTVKAISCYSGGQSSITSFAYVINMTVTPSELSSLLNNGSLNLPESGASENSTPSLTTSQQIIVQITVTGGTNTITLPADTTITAVNGQNFDATALTASIPDAGTLSGLGTGTVADGVLQWGIVNLGLQFSNPISISIFVGTSLNGQVLNIQRSTSGAGDWTSDGIAAPATCTVTGGYCSFSATKASYYVATHTTTTNTSSGDGGSSGSGGGGGGGNSSGGGSISFLATPTTSTTPITSSQGQVLGAVAYNFTKNLGVGSQGADVTALQQFLTDSKFYTCPITGYFGRQTKAAVIAYQKANNLPATGYVGTLTRAILNKGEVPTTAEATQTGLTMGQASAIVGFLQAFDADASIIANVKTALGLQ